MLFHISSSLKPVHLTINVRFNVVSLFPAKSCYQINDLTYNQCYLINKEIWENTVTLERYLLILMTLALLKILRVLQNYMSETFTLRQLIFAGKQTPAATCPSCSHFVLVPLLTYTAVAASLKRKLDLYPQQSQRTHWFHYKNQNLKTFWKAALVLSRINLWRSTSSVHSNWRTSFSISSSPTSSPFPSGEQDSQTLLGRMGEKR